MNTKAIGDMTIAEIVTDDYRTALIFKNNGIDFCCGGRKSVSKACREKNIDITEIEKEIFALQNQPTDSENKFNEWTLTFLVDYIVNVHHSYVNTNLTLITEFADKVARVHGAHHPETMEIASLWHNVSGELITHMKKEELVLFPYIKNLDKFNSEKSGMLKQPAFGPVKNPIGRMELEHDMVGDLMKKIQSLSANFTAPGDACNTYRVLYAKLKEFQNDLFQHIHLENNILFRKAIALETSIPSANIAEP